MKICIAVLMLTTCVLNAYTNNGHLSENVVPLIFKIDRPQHIRAPFEPSRKVSGGETSRYGVRNELCPNGVEPQRNIDGNIMWCKLDAECRNNYECIPIVGLLHFGSPVKYCCPTKSAYCTRKPHIPLDISHCTKTVITLYYFDINKRKCLPYTVTSCNKEETMVDEVQNRFGSLKDCRARCESTACEIGESPLYMDENLNQPYLCQTSDNCPHGYICRLDRLFRRQVCCGKTQFDPCPNYKTFIVPYTGEPKQCQQNGQYDTCPHDYLCTSSTPNLFSYCCASIQGVCPSNQKTYRHPLTGQAIKCNPHSYESACPTGFICQSSLVGSPFGFCCSRTIVSNCPRNTKPFINVLTNMPQKCTVGVTTCMHGYQCQNTEPNARIGYCCSAPMSIEFIQTMSPYTQTVITTTSEPFTLPIPTETIEEEMVEPHGNEKSEDRSERSLITTPSPIASLELSVETESPLKKTETTIRKKILEVINTLECPEDFEPMTYPNSALVLHCTRGHAKDCPAPSKCLKAVDDVLERALCCIHRDDKTVLVKSNSGSHEVATFKIVEDNIQLGQSTDPLCPTIILQRSCSPGTVHICKEENFFCQYNKQFKEYLCCSQFKTVGSKILYTQID